MKMQRLHNEVADLTAAQDAHDVHLRTAAAEHDRRLAARHRTASMNQSTTQTLDGAPPGGVTGRGSKEFREHVAVTDSPAFSRVRTQRPHTESAEPDGRVTFTPEVPARPDQRRRRGQSRWTLHTIPARLISRGPPRRRSKHDLPHSSHKSRREAAHVRTNSVLRDRASAPIGNRLSPIAVEARPPVLRVCAGRLVAPDRSTVHRTSAPACSPGAAGGVRRPGYLRRDQVGATIIAYGVSGAAASFSRAQPPPRPTHCR